LYEITSGDRVVWNEVFADVDRGTDAIENAVKPVVWMIASPTGNVIEEFRVEIPIASVPWA
jgi:hypothetical protein